MNWKSIGIEPSEASPTRSSGSQASFVLNLPLLIDGRIAFTRLRTEPDEAQVQRFSPGGGMANGHVRYVDGHWTFVWAAQWRPELPVTRLSGRRFFIGDKVMLRPARNSVVIYRVCEPELAAAVASKRA